MIVIPICLRCENVQYGMVCKKYPDGIPDGIRLSHKKTEELCDEFKPNYNKPTSQ